jgi:vacuole morphology and inheritance protein 14
MVRVAHIAPQPRKLFADVDVDVKNGANLLDRLMKDIVTESSEFNVEIFLPLLQTYIRRTNPFIRQLLVGWITVLDSIPDVSMIDYLPDFLDGLFNMLSDSNREIRQAADSALSDFLREVSVSTVVEFGPIVSILVNQCHSKERLNRLTAITWLAELIHHPYSGGDALLPYHDLILGAIMRCISDGEIEIRLVAERTNDDLLVLVRDTQGNFRLTPLLETLTSELLIKEDVPTKMAALRWINMLMKKRHVDMEEHIPRILPVLLRTLSDPSDPVVLLNLQVLSRISLGTTEKDIEKTATEHEEAQFQLVLTAILHLFCADRHLLETRGSLIIRKLCVLLNAKSVYIRIADALSTYESPEGSTKAESLEFVSTMVQTLNLILLTSSELSDLRGMLQRTFHLEEKELPRTVRQKSRDGAKVFSSLFQCWAHNPVATFSLCLLAQAYDLSFSLIKRFSSMEVTVGFLMQINKLVQLLESPIFVHLRLQLLDVDAPHHAPLLKSLYGLLMLMPQSDAFRSLNDRLTTVCNLRENLGIAPDLLAPGKKVGLNINRLLERFDAVMLQHKQAKQEESAPMTLSRTVMMTPNGKSPGVDGRGGKVHIPMSPTRPSTGGTPVELRAGARKSLSLDLK